MTGVDVENKATMHTNLPCLVRSVEANNIKTEPTLTENEFATHPVKITSPPEIIVPPLECGFSFDVIFSDNEMIDLPLSWSRRNITSRTDQDVQISQWTCRKEGNIMKTTCLKEIVIGKSLMVNLFVMGHSVQMAKLNISTEILSCASDLANIVQIVNKFKVCSGCVFENDNLQIDTEFTYKDSTGQVRHKDCPMLLSTDKTCVHCTRARSTLQRKRRRLATVTNIQRIRLELSPAKKKKVQLLRQRAKNVGRLKRHAQAVATCLRASMKKCQTDISELSKNSLENQLDTHNISPNQRSAILEIVAASKHGDSRGRRYSDDWMLLCMLLHMRSPCGYNFIRSNAILPLPCVRSIRRYLSIIDSPCGLDPKFFELFRLHLENKTELQRHGILLVDEMSTRENVAVDSRCLKYKGLVDFGSEEKQATDLTEKANHGLVFMFQPLADTYTQPIAVFALRGPATGTVLAKLIIKAIALLEKSGAKVHGVIGDGATPNRKFWSKMGICADRNNLRTYFEHPTEEGRKVFVFSDTPHLMKTVRNRFHKNLTLKTDPLESEINWEYFRILHRHDKLLPGGLRVCPKITEAHLNLTTSSAKMRVRLAVRVLSESMARGLRYYRDYVKELQNCEATAVCCEKFNSIFDALNRKLPREGIHLESADFKVLQDSLEWLNDWEKKVNDGLLEERYFLTKNTADGLRVTLDSTINLTKYSITNHGFRYVLTGKLNQDALEKFFGTVRLAGGSNDHPATPSFLQIYKILPVYSILKPPKSGNCTVYDDRPAEPLISVSKLRDIYKQGNTDTVLNDIKCKLDLAITHDDWDFEDVVAIEPNYNLPEVIDCVQYYVCGYLCHQILKHTKCNTCRSAFVTTDSISDQPVARLVNAKTHRKLLHPNIKFYELIRFIERLFVRHCN